MPRRTGHAVAGLAIAFLVGGCAATATSPVATAGQVKRLITCTVKPDADPATVLRAANELTRVSGALDVSAGYASAPITQSVTAPDRVVTFIITLRDEKILGFIEADPTYRRVRDDLLQPLCSAVATADVTLRDYQVSETFAEATTAATLQRRAAAIEQQNELRRRTK